MAHALKVNSVTVAGRTFPSDQAGNCILSTAHHRFDDVAVRLQLDPALRVGLSSPAGHVFLKLQTIPPSGGMVCCSESHENGGDISVENVTIRWCRVPA